MNPLELVAKTLYSFEEKELTYELLEAFGKRAEGFSQYNDVAKIFFEIKNFPKAIEYGEKALKLAKAQEEKYVTSKNLINAYNQFNYPEKAITQIEKCKKLTPSDPELLFEETVSYSQLGQIDKSHKLLFNLSKRNDLPEEIEKKVKHNLSGYYFRKDDLPKALEHFLTETEKVAYKGIQLELLKWDGIFKPGKTLVIDANCGGGDEVMHIRFMKHLKERGMRPIWATTRRELADIFNYNGFESVCVWDKPEYPEDASWVYALALPYHLGLNVQDLGREPYLKPLPEKEQKYSYIQKDEKYKIGVFWNSDSGYEQAHFRSVDFRDLWKVVFKLEHSLYSLQMSDNPVPDFCKSNFKEFHSPDREFSDTFSIINQMDLVITSCTSIAHIAASMGKETCIFVPIMEYYAWTTSTGKCWWYGDNVHMLKQKKPRNWDAPLQELKEFLNEVL
jgi:tetratricopeptide (TPR) repeat protein